MKQGLGRRPVRVQTGATGGRGRGARKGQERRKLPPAPLPGLPRKVPPGEGYLWLPRLPPLASDSPGSAKFAEVWELPC